MKRLWKDRKIDGGIDWGQVRHILLIRLRSIGDTVLMTPCLSALKQFRPDLRISVLSETMSAPLLEDHPQVDEVILLKRRLNQVNDGLERLKLVRRLRAASFDVAFNLHGGPTATLLCYLSRAKVRVGYHGYRYSWLHTQRAPDPEDIWQKPIIHSVEQQLGLLQWTGVPSDGIPATSLYTCDDALESAMRRLARAKIGGPFAIVHPAATSEDKRWPTPKFAQVVKHLASQHGLHSIVIGARHETHLLENLKGFAGRSASIMTDLHLKELIAFCSQARIFVGNDSGPAHIAVAMRCPTAVIFGASDSEVWRPWGSTAHAVIEAEMDFPDPDPNPAERISQVQVQEVIAAIDHLMLHTSQQPITSRSVAPSVRRWAAQ